MVSRHEQELLIRYRKYRRRKRILLAVCIAVLLVASGGYYVISNKEKQDVLTEREPKKTKDTTIPVLKLSTEKLEIEQGTAIDYMSYVLEATDNKDGELNEKVQYNNIDTNIAGDYTIVYKVKDKAGNVAKAEMSVKVFEKTKEETPVEVPQNNTPTYNEQIPDNQNTNNATQQPALPPLPTQYFLFSDGYNMGNVSTACADVLKSSGRSGVCSPIQDENGIYLGMRLDYD